MDDLSASRSMKQINHLVEINGTEKSVRLNQWNLLISEVRSMELIYQPG